MALPLYKCLNCSRRNDDPFLPIRCLKGRGHQWDKILGDGPQRLDTLIVCDATIDFQGGKAHCLLPENHYEDHKFFEEPSVEKVFTGGASSSECASFRLIPFEAIKRLADRCQLGLDRKGEAAWNTMNPRSGEMLDDVDWVVNRFEHAIKHSYLAIMKLKGLIPDDDDDDAAAVMWAGMLGIAADERRKKNAGKTSKDTTKKRDS
jgi:hypothetical protein